MLKSILSSRQFELARAIHCKCRVTNHLWAISCCSCLCIVRNFVTCQPYHKASATCQCTISVMRVVNSQVLMHVKISRWKWVMRVRGSEKKALTGGMIEIYINKQDHWHDLTNTWVERNTTNDSFRWYTLTGFSASHVLTIASALPPRWHEYLVGVERGSEIQGAWSQPDGRRKIRGPHHQSSWFVSPASISPHALQEKLQPMNRSMGFSMDWLLQIPAHMHPWKDSSLRHRHYCQQNYRTRFTRLRIRPRQSWHPLSGKTESKSRGPGWKDSGSKERRSVLSKTMTLSWVCLRRTHLCTYLQRSLLPEGVSWPSRKPPKKYR